MLPSDYIINMPFDKKEAQLIQSISELSNLRIKDVAETYSGTDKRRLKTTDENGGGSKAYLLKISDMEDEGSISIEKAEVIYLSDNVEIERLKLRQNDILLSARGTIDKVALIKEIPQGINLIASTNLISIRVDPSKYSSNVLFELLRSNYGKFMLTQVSSGGAISGLNVRNIENLKIPVIDGERFSGYRIWKGTDSIFRIRFTQVFQAFHGSFDAYSLLRYIDHLRKSNNVGQDPVQKHSEMTEEKP